MPEVIREGRLAAAVEDVWASVSAVQAMVEWYPAARKVEKLDGPDEGVGRVQRVRYKMGGRNAAVDTEVVDWAPHRRIVLRQVREFLGSKQAPLLARNVTTTIELEQAEDGTILRVRNAWEPVGLKGQLATETVLVPRAESLAQGVVERLQIICDGTNG